MNWTRADGHWTLVGPTFSVRAEPLGGLSVTAGTMNLPRLLRVAIADAAGLGEQPFASDMPPEVVARENVVWVKYPPIPARPVECQARWCVWPEGILDLEVSALTPGMWHGLSIHTESHLPAAGCARLDWAVPPVLSCRLPAHDRVYVEACHPHDGIDLDMDPSGRCGFRLFGHDLEKGVILRGRIRAWLLPGSITTTAIQTLFESFVAAPPNLAP